MSEYTSNGIRFRIHMRELEEPRRIRQQHPYEAIITIMDMSHMMMPYMEDNYTSIGDIIAQSMEEHGLEKKDIEILVPSQEFGQLNVKTTQESCSICQDNFQSDSTVSPLPCNHIFHTACIQEWGRYKPECPLCKRAILFNYT